MSRQRQTFAARGAVLAVAVVAVVLALAFPLKVYLGQRDRAAGLAAQIAASRSAVAALGREAAEWQNKSYVQAQAEQRLHMVAPGQKVLIPLGGAAQAAALAASSPPASGSVTSRTWFAQLWASDVSAGSARPHGG